MFPNKNVEFNSPCLINFRGTVGPTAASNESSSLAGEVVPAFAATGVAGLKNHDYLLVSHGVLGVVDAQVPENFCLKYFCVAYFYFAYSCLVYSYLEYSRLEYFCFSVHAT
jgi:hypothetical protein